MASTPQARQRRLLAMCASELIGTALLVLLGLSIVIFDLGRGSPVVAVLPSDAGRRALTGALFGATGMGIALSPVGRVSGAHINPVVSIAFWAERTLPTKALLAFVASQLVGAVVGAVPLLAWGRMGRSLSYAATSPGPAGTGVAFLGEVITTFCLIFFLLSFVSHPRTRRFTPGIFPPLYCVMVWLEAPWSGTSTNPARSLGPDVIALSLHSYWLYWAAPVVGTLAALAARRMAPVLRDFNVDIAKVAHFEVDLAAGLETRQAPWFHRFRIPVRMRTFTKFRTLTIGVGARNVSRSCRAVHCGVDRIDNWRPSDRHSSRMDSLNRARSGR